MTDNVVLDFHHRNPHLMFNVSETEFWECLNPHGDGWVVLAWNGNECTYAQEFQEDCKAALDFFAKMVQKLSATKPEQP